MIHAYAIGAKRRPPEFVARARAAEASRPCTKQRRPGCSELFRGLGLRGWARIPRPWTMQRIQMAHKTVY